MNQKNRDSIFAVLWVILACAIHIALFRGKVDMNLPLIQRLLFLFPVIAVTLPLHEAIHCLFMKLCGMKNVRIEFARDPLGIPSLRSVAQGEIHGARRILILLAPFVLLTLVPDILFCLSPGIHLMFFVSCLSNAAGCYFDAADVIRELRR